MQSRRFFFCLTTALSALAVGCNPNTERWKGDIVRSFDTPVGKQKLWLKPNGKGKSSLTLPGVETFVSTVEWDEAEDGTITLVTTCKNDDAAPQCDGAVTEWICQRDEDRMECYAPRLDWTSELRRR